MSACEMSQGSPGNLPHRLRRLVATVRLHAVAWLCHYLCISLLFFRLNRGRKRIITYHNVLPDAQFRGALHEGVSHSAGVFRQQLSYLRRTFPCDTDLDNPYSLAITFDDGYLNQYTEAHPALVESGLRAYFFCTLALWEAAEPLAIDRLLCWLSYVPHGVYAFPLLVRNAPLALSIASDVDRHYCWETLSRLLTAGEIGEEKLITMLEAHVPFASVRASLSAEAYARRFTSIPEGAIAEMQAWGHRFGAHGRTHKIMALLDDETLEKEVAACSAQFGARLNSSVFSYPYGGRREVTPRVVACVKAHGFTRAVSNVNDPPDGEMQYSAMFMPRFALPNTATPYILSFVLSGAKYFLQHRRLLPVCS